MSATTLTQVQLRRALSGAKYVKALHSDGEWIGVNAKIVRRFGVPKSGVTSRKRTNYVAILPCSFSEYLTIKAPYLNS